MRKLLTILGAVGLTATSTATVVACGNSDKNQIGQIDVRKINSEMIGSVSTQEQAIGVFLANNPNIKDKDAFKSSIIVEFSKPTTTAEGQLTITNSNRSAKIVIKIAKVNAYSLKDFIGDRIIQGSDEMTKEQALTSLASALSWKNLGDFVNITSFKVSNDKKKTNGSLTIEAKDASQYWGKVTISIKHN